MAESTEIGEILKSASSNGATPDKLAQEQMRRYDTLLSRRKAERDDDWQIISQYALPQESDIQRKEQTEGVAGWTDRIFDTTTIHAVETLASGLYNWWTPQNQPWNEYELPEELKDSPSAEEGRDYLGRASDRVMGELNTSNFYMVKATGDSSFATFATDAILFDESEEPDELFNFVHCKCGTFVIEENYKGIVDSLWREIKMTVRQIEQKFNRPGDHIPQKLRDQSRGQSGRNRHFKVLHCIFPRVDSERLPGRRDGPNKRWASVHIAMDFTETIRVSGYDENPILCRRFKKWVSAYGYGPCYLALPDSRQVNYVQQYLDALAELHAYPRIRVPEELEGDVDLRAGGQTVYNPANGELGLPSEWASVGDYKLGLEMQTQRRQAIKDACFVDAFKLLNSQPLLDKDMTAYEVSQRQAEQLQGMTPIDARHIQEFHNPLMARAFNIMWRRGRLGTAPSVLTRQVTGTTKGVIMPKAKATSRFQDALRALKNRGREAAFGMGLKIAEAHPEVLDVLDLDGTYRDYCRDSGVAPDNIRKIKGPNSVEAVRAQRAKLQQAQRQAQMAEQLGKAGKALGGAPDWMQQGVRDQLQPAQNGSKK